MCKITHKNGSIISGNGKKINEGYKETTIRVQNLKLIRREFLKFKTL